MDEELHDSPDDEPEPEPIPGILYSAYLEGPFTKCSACDGDLPVPDKLYQIQKTWRRGEVVFEIAICLECAARLMSEFSRESLMKMQNFFRENFREAAGIDECRFCGIRRGPDTEYEIGAACRGSFLLRPPVLVCADCVASSQENLSKKTRDAWGDFIENNLPGVPAGLDVPSQPHLL